MRHVVLGALSLALAVAALAPTPLLSAELVEVSHRFTRPSAAGLDASGLSRAKAAILKEIERGGLPGGAMAVGRGEDLVVEQGFGRVGWSKNAEKVDPDGTLYDLASLTKVVATTMAAMLLFEDGLLDLDRPVIAYIPEFPHRLVTIRHLLTHTSGLPAGIPLRNGTPEEGWRRILETTLVRGPGAAVVYSDVGFAVLWVAAERAAGEPLAELLARRAYLPLEMHATRFLPGEDCARCAPTARRANGEPIRGVVHDPTARALGGISGHAGLFSTAHDMARFAAMIAAGGELDGVRVLQAETIRRFTTAQPGTGTRTLGWDTPETDRTVGSAGKHLSRRAFGHTGFTGTSLWVDPESGLWAVILTNRVYEPRASNHIQAMRRTVHERLALSVRSRPVRTARTERILLPPRRLTPYIVSEPAHSSWPHDDPPFLEGP
jgi:CubicO group peptidase (beta-lactamase class C family)